MEDIFITELKIEKVRHLENITISLSPDERKHLILTGKNGSGKTSVLQAISSSINYMKESSEEKKSSNPSRKSSNDREINIKLNHEINQNVCSEFYSSYFLSLTTSFSLYNPQLLKHHPYKNYLYHLISISNFVVSKNIQILKDLFKNDDMRRYFENHLKDLFEDDKLRFEFSREKDNLYIIRDGLEIFDFRAMPDGYSIILNIISLMMQPENKHLQPYDVQGIVFIDGIDSHLHISLQKKILPFLTDLFPRIQFIISTHSPFVLNSLKNAVAYDLTNKFQISDLSGYSYDGIVESYFDMDKYSDKIKADIAEYERLVNLTDRTEDEEDRMMRLRIYLKGIPATLAKELSVKFDQIEIKRRASKQNG